MSWPREEMWRQILRELFIYCKAGSSGSYSKKGALTIPQQCGFGECKVFKSINPDVTIPCTRVPFFSIKVLTTTEQTCLVWEFILIWNFYVWVLCFVFNFPYLPASEDEICRKEGLWLSQLFLLNHNYSP